MRNSRTWARRWSSLGALSLALCAGCAQWNTAKLKIPEMPGAPNIHPMRKDRAEQAVKDFDRQRDDAQYQAAATSWRQGDYVACNEALDKILTRNPKHRNSLLLSADVDLENDRPTEAVDTLRKAVEAHPQDAEVAYKLALALEADHQLSESLHFFQIASQLAPTEAKYAEAFKFANGAVTEGAIPIIAATPEATATDDAQPVVLNETSTTPTPFATTAAKSDEASIVAASGDAGFAQLLASRSTSDAPAFQRALNKFLAKEPRHIEAGILQAEIDLENGKDAAARDRMERMVIRYPDDAQVRRACGLVYQAIGAEERAAECLARADALERGEMQSTATSVPTSYDTELQEVAPVASEASATVAISDEEVLTAAPVVLEANELSLVEKIETAPREVKQVLTAELTSQQYFERGVAELKLNQVDAARASFDAAFAADGENSRIRSDAAVQALQSEQPELARSIARDGARKFPQSAGLHRLHGMAALRQGYNQEAEAALRQSLSLDNSQALTYFLLGSVLDRLGKTDSAQWHLRQAAQLDGRYAARR
ncbi:MAG: hypothetical protein C0483_14415 [Pirellula sp.]|nr:hypothetical protein [Pirellula sp.]